MEAWVLILAAPYDTVKTNERIEYTLGDNRKVKVAFKSEGDITIVTETFDPETENPVEMPTSGLANDPK